MYILSIHINTCTYNLKAANYHKVKCPVIATEFLDVHKLNVRNEILLLFLHQTR